MGGWHVGYTVFHVDDLEWKPRREGDPRLVSELSEAMTQSRANLFGTHRVRSADATSTTSRRRSSSSSTGR